MRSIAVSGAACIDYHFKINSAEKLPLAFHQCFRKSIAYSQIPEIFGSDWDAERVVEILKRHSIKSVIESYGGRGPNVAYAIAKLGGDVRLITDFGDDVNKNYPGFFDGGYLNHLKKNGVKMELLKVHVPEERLKTPRRLSKYLKEHYSPEIFKVDTLQVHGKRTSVVNCINDLQGINFYFFDDFGSFHIEMGRPPPIEIFDRVNLVFVTTSECYFSEAMVKSAMEEEKEVIMDVGSYITDLNFLRKTIPLSRIVLGNEFEIGLALKAFNVKSIKKLFEVSSTDYPEVIIVEDKISGVAKIFQREGESISVGPTPINKLGNNIGCSDGIAAGFLLYHQHGFDLKTCVQAGMILCAAIWEWDNAQEGIPGGNEFYNRYMRLFGEEHSENEKKDIKKVLKTSS